MHQGCVGRRGLRPGVVGTGAIRSGPGKAAIAEGASRTRALAADLADGLRSEDWEAGLRSSGPGGASSGRAAGFRSSALGRSSGPGADLRSFFATTLFSLSAFGAGFARRSSTVSRMLWMSASCCFNVRSCACKLALSAKGSDSSEPSRASAPAAAAPLALGASIRCCSCCRDLCERWESWLSAKPTCAWRVSTHCTSCVTSTARD
mmetsp:Transcript_9924/g.27005  ORF Transcript_9924/g.27005 Transcript_9924/m.27005 type:complete len:206 (+) Transcript_9924:1703-2320(+)